MQHELFSPFTNIVKSGTNSDWSMHPHSTNILNISPECLCTKPSLRATRDLCEDRGLYRSHLTRDAPETPVEICSSEGLTWKKLSFHFVFELRALLHLKAFGEVLSDQQNATSRSSQAGRRKRLHWTNLATLGCSTWHPCATRTTLGII